MESNHLRELFLKYFESKGHKRIPSAPLVPENDPSVLFTTAGMHPLVPFLKGEDHPAGRRLTNVQKCLRTTDIDEVGDATHATVFEMLGNWSLGDYFKHDAIEMSWEFLTDEKWLGIDKEKLAVSVFGGDDEVPRDEESAEIWEKLGVAKSRIAYLGKDDNWWPAGGRAPGPQGPDSEMFYWTGKEAAPVEFDPKDERWVEIWNDVFMQFNRTAKGEYEDLPQKNVDTGMGLERVIMILNGYESIYEIDSYQRVMNYLNELKPVDNEKSLRILADHIKAATFILGDEKPVVPGNSEQGYVARRIIRRAVMAGQELEIEKEISDVLLDGVDMIVSEYAKTYPVLKHNHELIRSALRAEVNQFKKTLETGLKKLEQIVASGDTINGKLAYELYTTYGFPIELIQTEAARHEIEVEMDEFTKRMKQHQKQSRTASSGKFKGGLADTSEMSVKYHTATHLLHQALRVVLGDHVYQKGSNITPDRLRFDFSHPEKMTSDEKQAVEKLVNEKIAEGLSVIREEMTVKEAKELGALGLFEDKYADQVSVYRIGNFSSEICGGPHVIHTNQLGKFRINKEESASAGVRRIKAVLE